MKGRVPRVGGKSRQIHKTMGQVHETVGQRREVKIEFLGSVLWIYERKVKWNERGGHQGADIFTPGRGDHCSGGTGGNQGIPYSKFRL